MGLAHFTSLVHVYSNYTYKSCRTVIRLALFQVQLTQCFNKIMQLLHRQPGDHSNWERHPKEGPGTSTGNTGQTGSPRSAVEVIDDGYPDCTYVVRLTGDSVY